MDTIVRDHMIADYTTIGLSLGLPWYEARWAATEIVNDKLGTNS